MTETVVELPASMRDPMRREANRGLMVRFINNDLINRAALDVRHSYVLYDDVGVFEAAVPNLPLDDAQTMKLLYDKHGIRYWSKGV